MGSSGQAGLDWLRLPLAPIKP